MNTKENLYKNLLILEQEENQHLTQVVNRLHDLVLKKEQNYYNEKKYSNMLQDEIRLLKNKIRLLQLEIKLDKEIYA